MKNKKLAVSLSLFLATAGWAGASHAADENSIKGGLIFNPAATVGVVEYERLLGDSVSIGGRIAKVDYDVDDGSYNETGDGTGFELLVRIYPQGQGFNGFYLGSAVGLWNTDWEWTDPTDTPSRGNGSSDSVNVNVSFGWKIPLSKNIYFDPSFTLGNFLADSTESTGTQETELGVYIGFGLAIGGTF